MPRVAAAGQSLDAKLYVIPGSHPAMAARRMLELKGIPYKRVDLMPVISRGALRALRFPPTPCRRCRSAAQGQGSRAIAHELDRLRPSRRSTRADTAQRAAVEEAERLGEEELQPPSAASSGTPCSATAPRCAATRRAPGSGSRSGSR